MTITSNDTQFTGIPGQANRKEIVNLDGSNTSSDAMQLIQVASTISEASIRWVGAATFFNELISSGGTALLSEVTGALERIDYFENGQRSCPNQDCGVSYVDPTITNVTGNGTTFTLGSGNTIQESVQNSAMNVSSVFTAETTGIYLLFCNFRVIQASGFTDQQCMITASGGQSWVWIQTRTAGVSNADPYLETGPVLLSAGETVQASVTITGIGADDADLQGGTPIRCYLGGIKLF